MVLFPPLVNFVDIAYLKENFKPHLLRDVCTLCSWKKVSEIVSELIRKYHNHKPQTTPWHREEEPLNHHETPGRQIKQSNQLSLPHQDDFNTRMDIK